MNSLKTSHSLRKKKHFLQVCLLICEINLKGSFSLLLKDKFVSAKIEYNFTRLTIHLTLANKISLLGEKSITSDMQMTSPLWQKVKRN